jgi:glycosyltransferase involved in cell wall biosynthesis
MKIKILFLIEELVGGGKERRLVELLKGVSLLENFEIHLALTKSNVDYKEVLDLDIHIHHIYGNSNFGLFVVYSKLFKKIKPNHVHSWSYKTSFYTAILKSFYKFNFIAGFISDTFSFSTISGFVAKNIIFKKANHIVSNSKAGLTSYKVPANKGFVIYNGFDPSRIEKVLDTNHPTEFERNVTTLNIVMLANVTPYKDYETFIRIAKSFTELREDVTFLSIGNILPEYKTLTDPYLNDNHPKIKFFGFRNDVSALLNKCDLGVLCSNSEGISNAIIECMAHGLPIITTDLNGGSKEIIDDGINGFICSVDELPEKIDLLLNQEKLRVMMGIKAKEKIITTFSLDIMVKEYIKLYQI